MWINIKMRNVSKINKPFITKSYWYLCKDLFGKVTNKINLWESRLFVIEIKKGHECSSPIYKR